MATGVIKSDGIYSGTLEDVTITKPSPLPSGISTDTVTVKRLGKIILLNFNPVSLSSALSAYTEVASGLPRPPATVYLFPMNNLVPDSILARISTSGKLEIRNGTANRSYFGTFFYIAA